MGFFYLIDAVGEYNYLDLTRSIRMDLLELYGSYHVIEHVICEYNAKMERMAFWTYHSDILKAIVECMGLQVEKRFVDVISKSTEEQKTGDEIACEVITRLGLKGKEDDVI